MNQDWDDDRKKTLRLKELVENLRLTLNMNLCAGHNIALMANLDAIERTQTAITVTTEGWARYEQPKIS